MSPRIGIDARLAGVQHGGIGRYIENLVTRLITLDTEITWVIFRENKTQLHGLEDHANVELVRAPVSHYTLAEQFQMPGLFNKAELDLLHVPHFNLPFAYTGPTIITIHDLLWHTQKGSSVTTLPAWQYWIKYFFYKQTISSAVSKALKIIVPAKTVKNVLVDHYPEVKEKIVVTKEGVDSSFFIKKPQKRKPNTLLYVGSLYPHKNLLVVLQALDTCKDWQLRIISSRSVFTQDTEQLANKLGVSSQVTFLPNLADAELIKELASATALIQPSLSEGFGLTGIEAMAAGCPVIASDIPIFKEIYQDAAYFFDPNNKMVLINLLQSFSKKDHAAALEKGFALAHPYNWDTMAEKTLALYKEVMAAS